MNHASNNIAAYAIVGVVVVALMAFRTRRMMQSRPFRLQFVWIAPAIIVALTTLLLVRQPPQGREWLWVVGGFALGAGLGWFRAKTVKLDLDPSTRTVMAQSSPWAILLLLALIVLRFGLRSLLTAQSSSLGLRIAAVDGVFLAMACGLLVARAVEMGVRATRLLRGPLTSAPAV
jgi:hypothetical protein